MVKVGQNCGALRVVVPDRMPMDDFHEAHPFLPGYSGSILCEVLGRYDIITRALPLGRVPDNNGPSKSQRDGDAGGGLVILWKQPMINCTIRRLENSLEKDTWPF